MADGAPTGAVAMGDDGTVTVGTDRCGTLGSLLFPSFLHLFPYQQPCAYLILVGAILLFVTRLQVLATALTTVTTWMRQALDAIATLPYASIDGLYPTLSQTILIYIFILLFGILLTYSYLWLKT